MPWKPLDENDKIPTLGYDAADWMSEFLISPSSLEEEPFIPTAEQLDFLVRLYELDPITGKRLRHRAILSRPRGWGKSPFLAAIACFEALGDAVGDGYDSNGQPVGRPWCSIPMAEFRVLVTAATDDQTANTWAPLLQMLRGSRAESVYGLDVMDSFVYIPRGKIETRTASATSVKGAPTVCALMDQTETWLPGNGGVRLAQTLRNNAGKVGGVTIESPNAFEIGRNSVAEESFKTWEHAKTGRLRKEARSIIYFDHREAPVETDTANGESLLHGLRVAYGDSSAHPDGCVIHEPPCPPGWVDLERIKLDFWDTSNDPVVMRADFLNQISVASNAYITQPELRAAVREDIEISSSEPITLGFDGSEGRKQGIADCTCLVGYSIEKNHLFKIGCWAQPDGARGQGWTPPKLEIEQVIKETFKKYNVVGFFADPSAGWAGEVKDWEAKYHRRLKIKASSAEPIRYRQRDVTGTCEAYAQMLSSFRTEALTYDGSADMTAHFLHARKETRRQGYILVKPADDLDYSKIDLAVASMMAYRAGITARGRQNLSKPRRRVPRRLY